MRGKDKCRILREIRKRIAEENDITLITRECTYQGACRGTCPRCESEVRYLEAQLSQRQRLGKTAVVAALMAGVAMGTGGCGPAPEPGADSAAGVSAGSASGGILSGFFSSLRGDAEGDVPDPDAEVLDGMVEEPEEGVEVLVGEVELPYEPESGELEGDVAYIPED